MRGNMQALNKAVMPKDGLHHTGPGREVLVVGLDGLCGHPGLNDSIIFPNLGALQSCFHFWLNTEHVKNFSWT